MERVFAKLLNIISGNLYQNSKTAVANLYLNVFTIIVAYDNSRFKFLKHN